MKAAKMLLLLFLMPTVIAEPETCNNKMQNFGELGIDCGGSCDLKCSTCDDNTRNQGETEIDCGGPCDACKKTKFSLTTFTIILSSILITLTILYFAKKKTENNLRWYITNLRKKGYSQDKIKESLKTGGWNDKEIGRAYKER